MCVLYIHMYVCIHVCIYTHAYIKTHKHIFICTCVCMYACIVVYSDISTVKFLFSILSTSLRKEYLCVLFGFFYREDLSLPSHLFIYSIIIFIIMDSCIFNSLGYNLAHYLF